MSLFVSERPPIAVRQELETMKQRLKEMEDETNKLTAPDEGSEEGAFTTPRPLAGSLARWACWPGLLLFSRQRPLASQPG